MRLDRPELARSAPKKDFRNRADEDIFDTSNIRTVRPIARQQEATALINEQIERLEIAKVVEISLGYLPACFSS